MDLARRIAAWHETKLGLLIFGVIELALAGMFLLWAIDSGSLLDWFFVFVLVLGAAQNLIKLGMKFVHGPR